jgi:hypothetical protein
MTNASTTWSRRLGIVLAGFALVLSAAAGGAGAVAHPRAMSTATSPNPGSINYLRGVTAVSPDDAWAVGITEGRTGIPRSMTLHWNGTAWSRVASPNAGTSTTYLTDVSAAATDDVWAVGWYTPDRRTRSFAIHWDGADWTRFPTPDPSPSRTTLSAVSTVSATDAWAVGSYNPSGPSIWAKTLVLHWDGVSWSRVPSQNSGPRRSYLEDVAAITPTDLVAVGNFISDEEPRTRVLALDGPAWTRMYPPTGITGALSAIGASSTSDVWFAGYDLDRELLVHWNGSSWSRSEPLPDLSRPQLSGIAATSPANALAVGRVESGPTRTLLLHWNGTAWSRVASPSPGGLDDSNLWDGVSWTRM